MEPDFSGWATKAGLKCSDGRTIMPEAFAHMDGQRVPLVWQHAHNEPNNVLGHATLEARKDGVYAYGFFNSTDAGKNAKALVQHGDITNLSIFANRLVEKSKQVFHGQIREVSLVLSGANPGAVIENVAVQHSDGEVTELEDEAVIYTGLPLEHGDGEDEVEEDLEHADDETIKDVFNSFTEEEKQATYYMIGVVLEDASASHADGGSDNGSGNDTTLQDIFNAMSEKKKQVVYYMVGAAIAANEAAHSATDPDPDDDDDEPQPNASDTRKDSSESAPVSGTPTPNDPDKNSTDGNLSHKEGNEMVHNVFERNGRGSGAGKSTLSHSELRTIVDDAKKMGSFKDSFLKHAVEYGIENIDVLFPDAQAVTNAPELIARRQEWVNIVLNGARKTPFSRIKSVSADITHEQARAKGYVKGTLKKEEWFALAKRVTTPTTIYKKQKLDRDDIIDITDLDVVAWLKGEMRLMLDEEIARAVLVGDGREVDDDDKISEANIRPIAHDDDFYTHKVVLPTNASGDALVEAMLRARPVYRGSGNPTLFLTESLLTDLLLGRDKMGRRFYANVEELKTALRVNDIVTVDVMEDQSSGGGDLLAVMVNLGDYTMGADRGGNVSMFDDFDIDYNQYKYLIETRMSGALTKFKSALAFIRAGGTLVNPSVPTFNATTGVVTIPTATGVVYRNTSTNAVANPGNQPALNAGESVEYAAEPDTGYYFPHNIDTDWTFTRNL